MKTSLRHLTLAVPRLFVLCIALFLALGGAASAVTYAPTVFTDPVFTTVNNANGVITGGPGLGSVSLRSAVAAANSQAGPHIVNLAAGTYLLSAAMSASNGGGGLTPNDLVVGSNVNLDTTIQGADPANPQNTIIKMNVAGNDVIETAFDTVTGLADLPMKLTLKNLEVTGGDSGGIFTGGDNGTLRSQTIIDHCLFTGNTNTSGFAAGAITVGGGDLTVTNTTVSNNSSALASVGQGAGINYTLPNPSGQPFSQGTLLVQDSIFTNNSGGYSGGAPTGAAIFVDVIETNSLTIDRCTFTGNQAAGSGGGGAIGVANTNPTIAITRNNFSGNQVTNAAGHGGAIAVKGGTAIITFNRFSGNTAVTPVNGKAIQVISGTVDVNDNWWASNSGPAANDLVGVVAANFLQLKLAASPTSVAPLGTSALTASLLSDSANGAVAATNLTQLIGQAINFGGGAFGSTSGADATVQATGTAAATFTAGAGAGVSTVSALVDGVTATATVSVVAPPALTLVSPNSGVQGATNLSVAITGSNTNFVNGTSTVSFSGTGVTGTLSVTDATHATANITITGAAATGSRNVTVTTGGEVVTLNNGFTVTVAATISGTTIIVTGATTTLTASPSGGTWTNSNPAVATIDSLTGVVTGVSSGTTVLTYTLVSGGSALVTVGVNPLPTVVSATGNTTNYGVNSSVSAVPSANAHINWYDALVAGSLLGTGNVLSINTPLATATYFAEAADNNLSPLSTLFSGLITEPGVMFDVALLNSVTVTSFDMRCNVGTFNVEIYYKEGTLVGSENNAAAWTLLTTIPGSTAGGVGNRHFPLSSSLNLYAGHTYAFYITGTIPGGGEVVYSSGTTLGAVLASNADLQIKEGVAKDYPFAGTFSPRDANVSVNYSKPAGTSASRTGAILTVNPPSSDLSATIDDGKTLALAGAANTYTIVVSNAGPTLATGATVTATFPASFTPPTYTVVATGGATGASNGSGNISQIVNMPPGSTLTYTVTGTISAAATGNFSITASVTAQGASDPNTFNNSETDTDALNHSPVPGVVTVSRYPTQSVKIPVATITGAATDPDLGDTISLVSVANGANGTAQIASGYVFYTPTGNFPLTHTFTYVIQDNHGAQATGTVTVNIVTDNAPTNNITKLVHPPGGNIDLDFAGIPGFTYGVQYTAVLGNPWVDIGPVLMNSVGAAHFIDTDPARKAAPTGFYRFIYPAP